MTRLPEGAYISKEGWIVYDEEAFFPSEWRRPYRRLTDEERATYKRDWMRRWRATGKEARPHLVGSLHSLSCFGPTRATGCVCKKIKVYARKRAVA